MDRTAFTELECLYSTVTFLNPYRPYGLYRTSVPVQYSYTSTPPMDRTACTEPQCLYSTAIPLLPLWTLRPVQNLSACTVLLYLYSPYGPYGLFRTSVPVQYSYTSTLPIGRTACREPQCLYTVVVYLYLYFYYIRSFTMRRAKLNKTNPQFIFSSQTRRRHSCALETIFLDMI